MCNAYSTTLNRYQSLPRTNYHFFKGDSLQFSPKIAWPISRKLWAVYGRIQWGRTINPVVINLACCLQHKSFQMSACEYTLHNETGNFSFQNWTVFLQVRKTSYFGNMFYLVVMYDRFYLLSVKYLLDSESWFTATISDLWRDHTI